MEIYWATKSAYIGTPFFDATLGLSLEERFRKGREEGEQKKEVVMDSYAVQTSESTSNKSILGSSLGPHWLAKLKQHPNEKQVSCQKFLIDKILCFRTANSQLCDVLKLSNITQINRQIAMKINGIFTSNLMMGKLSDVTLLLKL